jgi:fibronectin type 3 domain-containing protein
MKKKMICVMVAAAIVLPSCFDDIEEVPLVIEEEDLRAPVSIRTIIGDGQIILSWTSVEEAVTYRLYRSQTLGEEWIRLVETADTMYYDETVVNGLQYLYSVSSVGSTGLESYRSEPVPASPSVYSVMINGGLESTGSRLVELALNAPASTAAMRISNVPDFGSAAWEVFSSPRTWMLDEGDGTKTVYASFQDQSGSISPPFSGTIELDTYAAISDFDITPGPYTYSPGATIHLAMTAEGNEPSGLASVDIEDLTAGPIELYDDGRGGDQTAGDGVYEADYTFPSIFRGTDLIVVVSYTDLVGNQAVPLEWNNRISFTDPPEAVQLFGAIDSTTSQITIRWEESTEEYFASYKIYRDTETGVTDDPALFLRGLDFITQTTYPDSDLDQAVTYYYRIYVANDLGETAGSNEISASTFDAVPIPVILSDPSAVGTDRLTLEWTINPDSDFEEYRIYRSTSPGVTDLSQLVTVITSRETTWFDDTGLDTGTNSYYYRILVYDLGGQYSRSNEVTTATP